MTAAFFTFKRSMFNYYFSFWLKYETLWQLLSPKNPNSRDDYEKHDRILKM
jgi:hypothetical protein